MNNKIKKNIKDKYRVLLTELLPYEVPLWFNNEHFYLKCIENNKIVTLLRNIKGTKQPFSYSIKHKNDSYRELSIMHPSVQLEFVEFYETYNELMIYYCTKSEKSLRAPCRVATAYYENDKDKENSFGVEELDEEQKDLSSYFVYQKHSFLYRFFESYEYHKLEKKFSRSLTLDIAKCFNHIYTHSISWAVKTKSIAKKNINKECFDKVFDQNMQNSNYKETNGILIGPEVSRIFAEIIMQAIDVEIIKSLKSDGKVIGEDYDFRRYVDDYYIFYNDVGLKCVLINAWGKVLSQYKLYINESKTTELQRPFITDITLYKREMSNHLDSFFKRRTNAEKSDSKFIIKKIQFLSRYANKSIVDIKSIIKNHNLEYSNAAKYFLIVYVKKLRKLYCTENLSYYHDLEIRENEIEALQDSILLDIELIYFVYCMDINVRSTELVSKAMLFLVDITKDLPTSSSYIIKKKIFDCGVNAIENFYRTDRTHSHVEILNLMSALSILGDDFLFEEAFFEKIYEDQLNPENTFSCFYFVWVSIMLYIKNHTKYSNLRTNLINRAVNYFQDKKDCSTETEALMFFLDFCTCPYVDENIKKDAKKIFNIPLSIGGKKEIYFVDWDSPKWIRNNLQKKKFTFPY